MDLQRIFLLINDNNMKHSQCLAQKNFQQNGIKASMIMIHMHEDYKEEMMMNND